MKTVGITGGTGLVGSYIADLLVKAGDSVVLLTRNPAGKISPAGCSYALFDAESQKCDTDAIKRLDSVINLAGEPIAAKRWTKKQKAKIASSRIQGTQFLASMIKKHGANCKTFITASGIGFYGADTNPAVAFTETSPASPGFLGDTCGQWEAGTQQISGTLRTVILRIGIVLASESGAFAEFAKPLKYRVMPVFGSGKQVTSWIHVTDLARLFIFALEHENISGIYNAVAPAPVSSKELMRQIAKAKGGPYIPAPVPAFLLNIVLGEMSIEVLKSCTVSSSKTLATGFNFLYPEIGTAVSDLIKK